MADPPSSAPAPHDSYRVLFEANPQPMWVCSPVALQILDANGAAIEQYGYTRQELLSMTVADLHVPEERDDLIERLGAMIRAEPEGRVLDMGLHRHRRKDGRGLDVEMSWCNLVLGTARAVLALAHDVTERNLAEHALWASEAQMRAVLETALDAIVLMDEKGLISAWNPRAEALFGWRRAEALGRKMADLIIPARYRELHARGLARFLETGDGHMLNRRVELPALRRDGSEVPVELRVTAFREDEQYVFCGFVEDVSARKGAEAKAALAEQQLATAQRVTHLGSWHWDLGSDHVAWSDELYRIYGLEPRSQEITFEGFLARVHPQDRGRVQAAVQQAIDTRGAFSFDERILRPDGSERSLRSQGEVQLDTQGRVLGLIGTCLDVTERRRDEDALRRSEERFAKAFAASPAAISISSLSEGRYLDVNPAFLRLIGRRRDEVLGRTSVEIGLWVHAEQRALFARTLERQGSLRQARFQFRTRAGEAHDVLVSAEIIELQGEKCVLAQSEDLTDLQRA